MTPLVLRCQFDVCDVDLDAMPDHFKIVWDANAASLTEDQKKPFFDLMKHQNVFAKSKHDLGRTTIVQHEIFTGDQPPIKQAPQMTLNEREIVQKEVQAMLEN